MKLLKIFLVLSLLAIGVLIYLNADRLLYIYPCEAPIGYKLGDVDSRFKLTRAQAQADIVEAQNIWGKIYGKDLFINEGEDPIVINFVYDERQDLKNQVDVLEKNVVSNKSNLDAQVSSFNQKAIDFKKRLNDLNSEIDSWNRKGGAPEDIYKKLIDKQNSLREESNQLQVQANNLNAQAASYNVKVEQLDSTINTFNSVLTQKPEEGLWNGKTRTISIYFNISKDELVHTLAHEFGHALGINHTTAKESIMYPYTSQYLSPTAEDISGITKVCTKVNRLEIVREMVYNRFYGKL